jgi:hypothetical protein
MKDKYINDIEPMIQNWLKSGNENTTMIAYEIAEYVREHVSNRKELLSKFYFHLCDLAAIDDEFRTKDDAEEFIDKFTL